jgi:hypothetical protein
VIEVFEYTSQVGVNVRPCLQEGLDYFKVPLMAPSTSLPAFGLRFIPKDKGLKTTLSNYSTLLLFITAVPNTKLCAWGEEGSGGYIL